MDVHLIDGTYELFRYYFAVPLRVNKRSSDCFPLSHVLIGFAKVIQIALFLGSSRPDHYFIPSFQKFTSGTWIGSS